MKKTLFQFASITLLSLTHNVSAQEPQAQPPFDFQAVYEAFSLPKSEAAELQRAGHRDEALYGVLIAAVDSNKAKQEKLMAVRSMSGLNSTVENIDERIYPTEYLPPQSPSDISTPLLTSPLSEKTDGTAPSDFFSLIPALAVSFDTKNCGDTMEMEISNELSNGLLSMRCTVTHVALLQMDTWGQGLATTEMPRFSVQKQKSGFQVKSGVPALLGTYSPALEAQDPDSGERVWFAFLTTTIIKSSK